MNSLSKDNLIKNEIPIINSPPIRYINQNDFIYFKNELLKDLKIIESKCVSKIEESKSEYNNQFENIKTLLDSHKSKIFEISSTINLDRTHSEKINKLFISKTNIEDKLFAQEKKIKELINRSNDTFYSLNKIIQDNIMYPGIIGDNSKFSSFHNFIDHILMNINLLLAFKEKMNVLDIKNYKGKLDRLSQNFKLQIDNFINSSKKITTETLITFDNKVNELLNLLDNKLEKEKNEFEYKFNNIYDKIEEENNFVIKYKNELMNKINKMDSDNKDHINNMNLRLENYFNEIEKINKKIEEISTNSKKTNIDFNEKMKAQEYKLIIKMSHLYSVMKDFNTELMKKFKTLAISGSGIQYNDLYLEQLIEKNKNNIKINEPEIPNIQLKQSHSVGSILKKYIDGEIGLNEFLHESRNRKTKHRTQRKNSISNILNDSDNNNKNKKNINDNNHILNNNINNDINTINNNSSYLKNIKYVKLDNIDIKKNAHEEYNNKKFLIRKKIDKFIIDNENTLLNKIPRKEIIKNLLMGSVDPISYQFMKKKIENMHPPIKINLQSKNKTARIKNIYLFKGKSETNLFSNERIRNKSPYNSNKKNLSKFLFNTGEDGKHITNEGIDNYQEKNKRTFSSLNHKSRNIDEEYSPLIYNITDFIKDDQKSSRNSPLKENIKYAQKLKINNMNSTNKIIDNHYINKNIKLNISNNKINYLNKNARINNENNNKLINIKNDKNNKSAINFYQNSKIKKDKAK